MAATVNSGLDFEIRNIDVNATTDTPIDFTNRHINSITIRCRVSTTTLYLRRRRSGDDYFTIPAGTSLTLDVGVRDQHEACWIRSSIGTPVVEVIGSIV